MKDVGNIQGSSDSCCHLRVGCALLAKKVARYLTPRMLETAAANGIELVQIDWNRSLLEQGPFHVIIHKLRPDAAWEQTLQEYKQAHPNVCIIDRLDRIRALHNRATMLTPFQGQGILIQQPQQQTLAQQQESQQLQQVRVQAPLQVEIPEGTTEAEAQAALAAAGLSPPLLCKPLWTDGREGSHGLAVLHDLEALGRLLKGAVSSEFKPPLVVQQFVEHGGVLFKVYVLGSQTVVTARPSLGETVLEAEQGVQQLPRISCVSVFSKQQQQGGVQPSEAATAVAAAAGQDQCATPQQQQQQQPAVGSLAAAAASWSPPAPATALCPPDWVTAGLAATLRQELGMQLFNFDLLVPEDQIQQQQHGGGDASEQQAASPLCYVVDINYFPGVDKLPDFEQRFVAFLRAAAEAHAAEMASSGDHMTDAGQQQQLVQQQSEVLNLVQQHSMSLTAVGEPAAAVAAEADAAAAAAAAEDDSGMVAAVLGPWQQQQQQRQWWSDCGGSVGSDLSDYSNSSGVGGGSSSGSHQRRQRSSSSSRSKGADSPKSMHRKQQQHYPHHHHHHHYHRGHRGSVGGLDAAGGVLGSSPPQLQVAGCS